MGRIDIFKHKPKRLYYVRNLTNRLLHWLMVFAVIDLCITGYYIYWPIYFYGEGEAYQVFVMADLRFYHFLGAMVLDISILLRIYLAFFSVYHRDYYELIPTPKRIIAALGVMKSYVTFKKPPFYRFVDPFDGLLFLGLHFFMVVQLVTGFRMYADALNPDTLWAQTLYFFTGWSVTLLGGLQQVRLAHHISFFVVIAGAILHIYIQIIKTVIWEDGHIASIFGGYKYADIGQEKPDERVSTNVIGT